MFALIARKIAATSKIGTIELSGRSIAANNGLMILPNRHAKVA
ncbi:MAG: hypothetical protein WCO57_13240 [Verrucomicrobiota bacterium]